MAATKQPEVIPVDWEHDVPLADIREARVTMQAELEAYYHTSVQELTDRDVARYLVRVASLRYLRPGLWAWK